MFNAKKRTITGIVLAVLIVACIAGDVFALISADRIIPKIGTVMNLAALACALLYCLGGYRKKDSLLYKGFFIFYALHILVGIYGMVTDVSGSAVEASWTLAFAITFANMMLLFIPENLGKKKSTLIAAINVIIWIGFLIYHIISAGIGVYTTGVASYLVSALIAAVLVYAKYADKAERKAGKSGRLE